MKLVPSAGDACAALALGLVILTVTPAQADPTGPDRAIACDTEALKNAIHAANTAGGGTVQLARRCTYTLTTVDNTGLHGANGLPLITAPITLRAGKNTVIERSAAAPAFRIFEVTGPAGALTLDGTNQGRRPGDHRDPWNTADALLTSADRDDRDRACRNGSGLTVRGGSTADRGGAVFVDDDRSLTLHCVSLTNNTAANGGAVQNLGTADVRASTLSENSAAAGSGGAISSQNGELNLTASKLSHNTAAGGGGLFVEGVSATISASVIEHNTATSDVGGIYVAGGVVDIVKSTIRHNTATNIAGGLASTGGSVHLRHSSVSENTARQAGGIQAQSQVVVDDSKVNKNTADLGGGIVVIQGNMTMSRSQVNENRARITRGAGIINVNTLTLTDVEVARNVANAPAGGIHNSGTVTVNGQTRITDNTPTNCTGSATPVPGCVG
ncbi:hypothetical protein OHA27_29555 [Streptomyces sp. NBC_01619]|uniref:hypothetical protein n=1 Tax=Streptomyces sp. NBC_01619 TaxID=2975901 RepID=UPI002259B9B8|nr:hypothetical protein [Streptomyces sp. NBC_01619]MCX4514395.1 hypothetical protein [Streptomyces sp. NBC_01619]